VWYRQAAEQGQAAAQNSLGDMYVNGQGVPQDYGQAMSWYRCGD
jgi:TPR repeat protein